MNLRRQKTSEFSLLLASLLVALNLRLALASVGPVLEPLRAELQLSYGIAGLLTSLSVICMGLFAPAAMPLSVRLGTKSTISWALVLLGLATLLRVYASLSTLLLSAFLVGAAIAVLGPLLSVHVKQVFPTHSARTSGQLTTALCLGAALAAGSSAILSEYLGWPCALSSWSLLAFIAAWLWQRTIPISGNGSVNSAASNIAVNPWRQRRAWLLLLVFGLQSWVFYALLAWLAPAYLSYGLSAAVAGRLLGVFALAQIAGTLLISALPTRQRERRPALLLSGACTWGGLLAVWLMPLAAPYIWMCLLGMGTAGLFALTLILPLDYSDSPEAAGSLTAMMSSGGYVIAASGPYLCGMLRDVTGNYAVVFATLCVVSGTVLLLGTLLSPMSPVRPSAR